VLQVLKVAPDHMPGMLLAGAVEFASGSYGQAQSYLGRVLDRAPDNLYARRLLIGSLAKSGQVQRAQEALQPGLKQFPEDAALMGLAGEVYLQSNEFAKAISSSKGSEARPEERGCSHRAGPDRLARGERTMRWPTWACFAARFRQVPGGHSQIMSHLRQANYDQALKAIQTLGKQPNNPLTYNLKAMIYADKKDTAVAQAAERRSSCSRPRPRRRSRAARPAGE
jgi:predicted Zn-dependent protease